MRPLLHTLSSGIVLGAGALFATAFVSLGAPEFAAHITLSAIVACVVAGALRFLGLCFHESPRVGWGRTAPDADGCEGTGAGKGRSDGGHVINVAQTTVKVHRGGLTDGAV